MIPTLWRSVGKLLEDPEVAQPRVPVLKQLHFVKEEGAPREQGTGFLLAGSYRKALLSELDSRASL